VQSGDSSATFTQAPSCGTPRVDEWLREFQGYQGANSMPTMQFIRLGNDHTQGTKAGAPTPKAYVADNDLALGRLVDAVSHSQYWKDTVIMVTEDDAQNGPDHVDAHRTLAQVISPYTRTGRVDSTFYSTSSMLRTMELLVGLGPLTQFDAYAAPLAGAFTTRSDTTPYTALVPRTSKEERNTAASPLAAQSAAQDTTVEDAIDEQTFNQAVWQSVRGANSPMPAPRYTLRGAAGAPAPAAQPGGDPDDK
jgi:DNA-binding beta-propeller fold protein YncE